MTKLRHLALAGALVLAASLGGCAFLDDPGGTLLAAGASVGDAFVTPAVHAPIANSAAAAENLYTGAQEILTMALKDHALTKAQALQLDPLVDKVYAVVVQLRAVQQGQDVTVLLKSFNTAFGNLFDAAKKNGVALPTAAAPATGGAT